MQQLSGLNWQIEKLSLGLGNCMGVHPIVLLSSSLCGWLPEERQAQPKPQTRNAASIPRAKVQGFTPRVDKMFSQWGLSLRTRKILFSCVCRTNNSYFTTAHLMLRGEHIHSYAKQ